jgi:hypothetical protein
MDINALAWDSIKGSNDVPGNIIMDLINPLPTAGTHGTTITWSETSGRINTITGVVTRPSFTQGDQTVTLTATVSKSGGTSQIKNFVLTIRLMIPYLRMSVSLPPLPSVPSSIGRLRC